MELRGTVKRIIYANPETNYYVFTLEDAQDSRSLKKAKGNFLLDTPFPGQDVVLQGDWEDTKYGPTFGATAFEPGALDTTEGIQKYLVNYVKGVGAVTAKRLVDHFGTDTLDVLTNDPERLEEVPNMNRVQRETLAEEWATYNEYRGIAIHLLNLDLPSSVVKRIYDTWGSEVMKRIDENPYSLMEIRGVGFTLADRVALAQGVAPDSPFRIGACIEYTLKSASQGPGHLYMEAPQLVGEVYRLIRRNEITGFGRELDTSDIKEALKSLKERERIVVEDGAIYLTELHFYESQTARMMANLMGNHDKFPVDVEEFISDYETNHSIEFSEEQREAIRLLRDHKVLLVTGLPGTGKTTLTKALVAMFNTQNLQYQLMSPTGIAAKKLANVVGVQAATIHRALGYRGKGQEWIFNAQNKLPVDAVIVDEVSMVDQQVMYRLLSALNEDTILVLVGDHAQLPSVGAGNVLHELMRSKRVPMSQLSQIFRQEEASDIIINAHRINAGQMPVLGNPTDSKTDFRFISRDRDSEILEGILKVVEGLQKGAAQGTTFQVLSTRWKGDLGVNHLNEEIREVLNPLVSQRERGFKGGMKLREGDRVMVTSNDYEKGVFNGEVGTVTEIDIRNNEINVRIRDANSAKLVHVPFNEVPDLLNLAFCITIHKSQGMGYDYVIMPFIDRFSIQLQRNLLYTAVTRASKKVFMFGDWSAVLKAVGNNEVVNRNTVLAERISGELDRQ